MCSCKIPKMFLSLPRDLDHNFVSSSRINKSDWKNDSNFDEIAHSLSRPFKDVRKREAFGCRICPEQVCRPAYSRLQLPSNNRRSTATERSHRRIIPPYRHLA